MNLNHTHVRLSHQEIFKHEQVKLVKIGEDQLQFGHDEAQKSLEQFFVQLKTHVDSAQIKKQGEIWNKYNTFFNQLDSRLEMERKLASELNRHLACQFNVLDFLRDDEYGLSRIIASFLDPKANHGQGPYFLCKLCQTLRLDWNLSDANLAQAKVELEKEIEGQRRIDIYIQIRNEEGKYCIAMENKPYAEDQINQVRDYLEHLRNRYSEPNDNYLMIYLSGLGKAPSEHSLSKNDFLIHEEHLTIMPYCKLHEESEDEVGNRGEVEVKREPPSLVDWLTECRIQCVADRLRWFLSDIESFCLQKFGAQPVTSDSEKLAIQEFLYSNPGHLKSAQAVAESWSEIENDISDKFLMKLHGKIQNRLSEDYKSDLCIDKYIQSGSRSTVRKILVYRKSWKQYSTDNSSDSSPITIFLSSDGKRGYFLGVELPDKAEELEKCGLIGLDDLSARINTEWPGNTGSGYLVWKYLKDGMKNWDKLIPELFRECDVEDGEITEYHVKSIIDLATKVIPIIDEFEETTAS